MPRVKIEFKIEEVNNLFHPQPIIVIIGSSHLKTMHLSDCQLSGFLLGAGGSPSQFFPSFHGLKLEQLPVAAEIVILKVWLYAWRDPAVVFY